MENKKINFCGKCGAQMEADATCCSVCGASIDDMQITSANTSVQNQNTGNEDNTANQEKKEIPEILKKLKNPKIIAAIIAVVAVAIISICLIVNNKKTINLEDCVTIECTGADGYGTATAYIDSDKFDSALIKAMGKKYKSMDDIESWDEFSSSLSLGMVVSNAYDSIEVKLNKTENIKNGDKLEATITYDQELAKQAGIRFKGKKVTMSVKDLGKVKAYDPFDDLEVIFNGTEESASVELEYVGDLDLDEYDFSVNESYGLKEGDTITVTLKVDEQLYLDQGIKFKSLSKDYKVEGLAKSLTDASQLNEGNMSDIIDKVTKTISSTYEYRNDMVTYTNLTYKGSYVLSAKPASSASGNRIFVIMSATVSSVQGEFETQTIYMPVEVQDVYINSDGIISDEFYVYGIDGYSGITYNDGWSELEGYRDLTLAYDELIAPNSSVYDISMTDGVK